jgi:hypothetical protein
MQADVGSGASPVTQLGLLSSICPIEGNRSLFSENGLKDNRQLYAFLEQHEFEIEHKAFFKRPRNETDESEELIVLVARKCRDR